MATKKFSTIALEADVLEELKGMEIDYHGIPMDNNSRKISALIKLYKQNYKTIES